MISQTKGYLDAIANVKPPEIHKTYQLFIRACKSRKDPRRRVLSVYRRFYLDTDEEDAIFSCGQILLNLVDRYVPVSVATVIAYMNPAHSFLDNSTPYNDRCLDFFISRIRLAEAHRFPGLTAPRSFRPGGRNYHG